MIFFFISDISRALTNRNIYTNCYIPKIANTNQPLLDVEEERLNIFNAMFKITNNINYNFTQGTLTDQPKLENTGTSNCFKLTTDGQVYTKDKEYYAYYKKPILDEDNINLMTSLKSPDHYFSVDLYRDTTYDDLLRIGTTVGTAETDNTNHGELVRNYIAFIVEPDNLDKENSLTASIENLRGVYNRLESKLNDIKSDL